MKKMYEEQTNEEMILRDHLALDRTILANERTLLSYIRTMLAVVVVGATLIHLSSNLWLDVLGVLAILSGIILLIVGIKRTVSMSRAIYAKKK